ncbi:uncharacterized protein [Miscanthus floridulus]|uniref:uncharacterized protein n=1 Tax=Miscanthus floridulus TaxID=154761 RepID=UPI00345A583C
MFLLFLGARLSSMAPIGAILSQQLWEYLTGERTCPQRPALPRPPTYPPDVADDAKSALLEVFETEMEDYQSDLGVYETWLREEACAKAILVASIEVDLSGSLRGLSTTYLMWAHLCRSYETCNEAMYLAIVEEAQALRQLGSTVEDFHRQMSAIWHCLDSLGAEFCSAGTCRCCERHRSQRETLRLHEFLSRLRPEFASVRAQLLTRRPCPSLFEAMPELQAEETCLRIANVSSAQQQPSMLAAMPSQVSSPPPSLMPPPSLVAAGTSSGVLCGYCKWLGHDKWACHKKKHDRNRKGRRSSTPHATHSVSAAEQEILALFRRLATATQTSAHGTTVQAFVSTLTPHHPDRRWHVSSYCWIWHSLYFIFFIFLKETSSFSCPFCFAYS